MIAKYGYRFGAFVLAIFLVVAVSCNEPTEVTVIAPEDTVTVFHFDTTVVYDTTIIFVYDTTFVTDTLRIYCWLLDDDDWHDRTPLFECDDGYRGPRI